jgi:magnesium-transporting ATPase (P-type)
MLTTTLSISRDRGYRASLTLPQHSFSEITLCFQDINEQNSMDYPQLYEPGQLNLLFNKRRFFICVAHGIYTSLALFFIPYGAFYNVAAEDGQHIADLQSFAVTVATSLVIVVSIQVTLFLKALLLWFT